MKKITTKKQEIIIPQKKKLNIKAILITVLIFLLIIFLLYFFLVYRKPSNILKRYLIDNNYTCTRKICNKNIDGTTYSINYETGNYQTNNLNYSFTLNKLYPTLIVNSKDLTCTYTKEGYSRGELVDNTFTYTNECQKYIENVNEYLGVYNEVITKSKIDINNL